VVNGPFNYVLAAESASLELSGTHSWQLFRAPSPNAKMCPLFLAGFSGGNNPPLRFTTVRALVGNFDKEMVGDFTSILSGNFIR
jgi:hypothetical protein